MFKDPAVQKGAQKVAHRKGAHQKCIIGNELTTLIENTKGAHQHTLLYTK